MAKKERNRGVDFSRKEMATMSGCASVQTFDYRMRKLQEHYGLNINELKMSDDKALVGGETYYPAECGELIALLARSYEKNPASKAGNVSDRITAEQVAEYYEYICEEVENLPAVFRDMVYVLPSHFTTKRVAIWARRAVVSMEKFILHYVKEQNDDMGALLQRISVDIDKADYNLFFNHYFMRLAADANECPGADFTELMDICKKGLGYDDDDWERKAFIQNAGLDREIAFLINRLLIDANENKDRFGFEENDMPREEYYELFVRPYVGPGKLEMNRQTFDRYVKGANGWKTVEQRIKDGDRVSERAISTDEEIRLIEQEIVFTESKLKDLREQMEELKCRSNERRAEDDRKCFEMIDMANSAYLEECDGNRSSYADLHETVDRFVGRALWELLDKK